MTETSLRDGKKQIRSDVLTGRAGLDDDTVRERAEQFGEHIDRIAAEHGARTVTAYASVGTEPGTRRAIDRMHARGVRILLPIVLPDLDLDWATYTPDSWHERKMGLVEPVSAPLGRAAIGEADIVFCPGVAGTPDGRRLGRGGGCYDRALTRARADATRCLVVYDENVLDDVPTTAMDQLVDMIITPTRVITCADHRA